VPNVKALVFVGAFVLDEGEPGTTPDPAVPGGGDHAGPAIATPVPARPPRRRAWTSTDHQGGRFPAVFAAGVPRIRITSWRYAAAVRGDRVVRRPARRRGKTSRAGT
jgi:hypothetical protein